MNARKVENTILRVMESPRIMAVGLLCFIGGLFLVSWLFGPNSMAIYFAVAVFMMLTVMVTLATAVWAGNRHFHKRS